MLSNIERSFRNEGLKKGISPHDALRWVIGANLLPVNVIHTIVDSKGRPLSFTLTGGQVHDAKVVEGILTTPRSPLAITADKVYDSEKVRQQIKDEGALPIIPNCCAATRRASAPSASIGNATKLKTAASRIGGVWRSAMTSSRNFLVAAF
jgi:hypothetical protein